MIVVLRVEASDIISNPVYKRDFTSWCDSTRSPSLSTICATADACFIRDDLAIWNKPSLRWLSQLMTTSTSWKPECWQFRNIEYPHIEQIINASHEPGLAINVSLFYDAIGRVLLNALTRGPRVYLYHSAEFRAALHSMKWRTKREQRHYTSTWKSKMKSHTKSSLVISLA